MCLWMYVCVKVFYLYADGDHRDRHVLTHSFPTRRSSDLHGRFAGVDRSEGHRCRKPPRLDQERAVIARRKIEGFTPLCRLQGGGKLGGAGDCDRGCEDRKSVV